MVSGIVNQGGNKKKTSKQFKSGKKKLKLVVFMIQLAPKIIAYAKETSIKMKKRNSNQLLLFPNSDKTIKREYSDQMINEMLIDEYRAQSQKWYDFYFQPDKMFIDNRHLQILQHKQSISVNMPRAPLGRVILFGESVAFQSKEFSDDSQPIISMGTQNGEVVLLAPSKNSFKYLQVTKQKSALNAISIYGNHLLAFTYNTVFIITIEARQAALSISLMYTEKISGIKMRRAQFVSDLADKNSLVFHVYYVNDSGLWKASLKSGIFSNIDGNFLLESSQPYNPFTNMKIFYQQDRKRVIITVSSTKQIVVLSHFINQTRASVLHRMPNPKNPPAIPKFHIYNCIEYFVPTSQLVDAELLIAVSFTERIYFIGIWPDYCQVSKRVKLEQRILRIINLKNQGIITVNEKQHEIQNANNVFLVNPEPIYEKRIEVKMTRLSEIISFSKPIVTPCTNIISFDSDIQLPNMTINSHSSSTMNLLVKMTMFHNSEILVIGDTEIYRIGLKTWQQVYLEMRKTQNIQLLYFLILLKNSSSLFFQKPISTLLEGLENIFDLNQPIYKQLMLEYYCETGQSPPAKFIMQIQDKEPELLLPFILYHKIQNLSDSSQQMLIEYYKKKDLRVVEQIIISGVEHGWQIAVNYGWMRALRKMVQMGMEIHFPLLKISSFIIHCRKELKMIEQKLEESEQQVDSQRVPQQDKAEELLAKVGNYCHQIVQYSILALQYFLQPQSIEDIDDYKEFIMTILNQEIFVCLIKFKPLQMIKLLSKLFDDTQRISLMERFDIEDFINFSKMFKYLAPTHNVSISEIIYSHFSEFYRQITQNKPIPPNLRLECRHLLFIEHAKLIKLKAEDHSDIPIVFMRKYLIQMLYSLSSNDNQDVKVLIKDQRILMKASKEEIQCYIQDFLVLIWQQVKKSQINISGSKSKEDIRSSEMLYDEMKEIVNTLEQINNQNSLLLIKVMESMSEVDYCVKILKKYLQSRNIYIRERIFDWIVSVIESESQRRILQSQLMNYLSQLIQINKEKSRTVLNLIYANKQRQIIQRIDNDPYLQLQYLEMIINDAKDDEKESLEENFLKLHLKLLLQEQPERVISVLEAASSNNIKYDLHEGLRLSIQNPSYPEKNKIQTYLYEKTGDVEKCIRSYLKMLGEVFWVYAQLYEAKKQSEEKLNKSTVQSSTDKIGRQYTFDRNKKSTQKLSLITEILTSRNYNISNSKLLQLEQQISDVFKQMEELIFRQTVKKYEYLALPLSIFNKFFDQLRAEKLRYSDHYESILVFYFGQFLLQLCEKGYVRFLIRWIKNTEKANLSALRKNLIECYTSIKKQRDLLLGMSDIDQNVLVKNINENLIIMEKSIYSESKCPICEKQFNDSGKDSKGRILQQQALLFNCGHLCHKQCIEQDQSGDDLCWQCIYQKPIKAMIENSEINLVQILKKYHFKKKMPEKEDKQGIKAGKEVIVSIKKKRIQRMGIFDKKVSTIQNQAQILDMKLEISDYYDSLAKTSFE